MRIGLIPLDERPVNTRYPAMIAQIAGADLHLPPRASWPQARTPADTAALARWLEETAPALDALIVSVEMLAYGGLIASRISADSAGTVLARLDMLRAIRAAYPALALWGFNLVRRTAKGSHNFEEPLYWNPYGPRLYRYQQLLDQQAQGQAVEAELAALRADIPPEHLHDFLLRRLRSHTVNLGVLDLLAGGALDLLVLSSDDTSEYGLGSREKRWLAEWAGRVIADEARLLMYPGADEVGCALLARAFGQGQDLRFAAHYAIPEDHARTAPYEDGPLYRTVERQVHAVGGTVVAAEQAGAASFVVAVNPPSPLEREFDPVQAEAERRQRRPYLERFVERINGWLAAGKQVIVCDVAYPNGSDPVLIDLLCQRSDLTRLAAYGGWNTAGNTIGTALAQGVAASLITHTAQQQAQQRFLLHRLLEDWGYQHLARQELRAWLAETTGQPDAAPDLLPERRARVEARLSALLATLPGFAGAWRIVPESVRFPWERTFEVDFDLEPLEKGDAPSDD